MATHSSILAWKTPWTEEPGGPQSMGSQRVGHDLATEHKHDVFNNLDPMWDFLNLSFLFTFPLLFRINVGHFLREKDTAEECFGKHNLQLK